MPRQAITTTKSEERHEHPQDLPQLAPGDEHLSGGAHGAEKHEARRDEQEPADPGRERTRSAAPRPSRRRARSCPRARAPDRAMSRSATTNLDEAAREAALGGGR